MQELQALETTTDKLRDILTPDQTAKYLIFVEKVMSPKSYCSFIVKIKVDIEHF